MNEHIGKIAAQCWDGDDFEIEKFAELIIKECTDIMHEQKYNTTSLLTHPAQSSAIRNARIAIENKFGKK